MKARYAIWLCLGASIFLVSTATGQTDPLVEQMVEAVSKTSVTSHVQTLQDFETRYTYTQGNTEAGDWLFAFFAGLGIEVERHSFTYGSYTEENIIARIRGVTAPDEIVAISGHFDSTSDQPSVLAPGADDNASGIAAVLEAARVMKDYDFERTVEFMCFNAEEQGRRGSQAIAVDYLAEGRNLVAVVNSDMIGYWPTGWQRDLDVAYEPISEWLADHVISVCGLYVGVPIAKHLSGACRDDHISFTDRGIASVTNMDCWEAHNGGGESTPHYHRTTDTIATLNLDCMTQAVQVAVAALAELAAPAVPGGMQEYGTQAPDLPATARLLVHPNPFRDETAVSYRLPEPGHATLRIYDTSGSLVRRLIDGAGVAGNQTSAWDGEDDNGRPLAAGLYIMALQTQSGNLTKRIILLK